MKKSLFRNNGFITLFATLFGVLFALFLNECNDSRKLNNKKVIVTENILKEIKYNKEFLSNTIIEHQKLYETLSFINSNISKDQKLITSPKTMSNFVNKNPNVFAVEDSIKHINGKYEYKGEVKLNLSLPRLNLKTIAWRTLKNNEIASTYSFECMMHLESINILSKELVVKNQGLMKNLEMLTEEGESKYEKIISSLKSMIDLESHLISLDEDSPKILNNCS